MLHHQTDHTGASFPLRSATHNCEIVVFQGIGNVKRTIKNGRLHTAGSYGRADWQLHATQETNRELGRACT